MLTRDASRANMQSRTATDAALKALLARGIPTFAASGDDGARDNDPYHNWGRNADYPAASPYAFGELDGFTFVCWRIGGDELQCNMGSALKSIFIVIPALRIP